MQDQLEQVLSHPYITTPIAIAASINPWIVDGLPVILQVLGIVFLVAQIFYIFKNKGKK